MAVTNKRGIFALLDVRERQATGVWSVKPDVWLSPSPYFVPAPETGYFGGGGTGDPAFSDVDRIDYSNDTATASPKGPLSAAGRGGSGTGNSSYGWMHIGYIPIIYNRSIVNRIDYSNDTATASVRGPLNTGSIDTAATGNASYGYVGGGRAPALTSRVDRIDYSNDTATASPKGPLNEAVYGNAACSPVANGL